MAEITRQRENELMEQYAVLNFLGRDGERDAWLDSLNDDERAFIEIAVRCIALAWLRGYREAIRVHLVKDLGEREYAKQLEDQER